MRSIKELYLHPLTGLYYECHNIDYAALATATGVVPDGKYCLRPLNSIWWHDALSRETLETIVQRLRDCYRHTAPDVLQHRAVLADPEAFIAAVQEAPKTLANLGAGARKAFGALESLQVFCNLYSDTISSPFLLSLQEGLVVNELSSLTLAREALNPVTNPYLAFIERHYLPVLHSVEPNLLWIVGPIKMSTFAMAMMARDAFPDCHISVTGHSSEYYSLNKITRYLQQNTLLFSVIDSIVLDDFENTVPQLVECLAAEQPLDTVPNLLYADRGRTGSILRGGEALGASSRGDSAPGSASLIQLGGGSPIASTPLVTARRSLEYNTHHHPVSVPVEERTSGHVDPSEVVDIKLWPNAKCYWDQCNFCGINRKYQTLPQNSFRDAEEVAEYMLWQSERGVRNFWSVDEAIPPKTLGELANALIRRGADITWETRSKIDRTFTPEICDALGRSGLREIRLGLESASLRVLSAMGKFPDGWSLELIEQVVSYFHDAGVSVHFPTIVGFPTETDAERAETFAFLQYIIGKYPSVTFNMNVLGFDVGSKLFENYQDFGITTVRWPAPAKYFLGNLLDWDCAEVPFEYERLDQQRNDLMRRLLYPWMPTTATIPPYIYYRLSETSRATMIWKSQRYQAGTWRDAPPPLEEDAPLAVSPQLVVTGPLDYGRFASDRRYFLYDWGTHHSMECDSQGMRLLDALRSAPALPELMEHLWRQADGNQTLDETYAAFGPFVERLYRMGILYHPVESGASAPGLTANVGGH
jgi:hypothetical protein